MQKYRIVTIMNGKNPHCQAFKELSELLRLSLADLGWPVDETVNALDPEAVNIILGYNLFGEANAPALNLAGVRYIVYQLECLVSPAAAARWWNPATEAILRGAEKVWDYYEPNLAWLAERGIHAEYVPVGYHPGLAGRIPTGEKDIDVLFYGSMDPRRRQILDKISALGLKVLPIFGIYGAERDALIGRSKIVLNLHYYPENFEIVRMSYLLNNGVAVVSEKSIGNYENLHLENADSAWLPNLCKRLISEDSNDFGTIGLESFKLNYAMINILARVMPKAGAVSGSKEPRLVAPIKKPAPKIYFVVPHRGAIRPEIAMLTAFFTSAEQKSYRVVLGEWPQLAPVDLARNVIVEKFLHSDCTHLLMCDADIVPPPNILELVDFNKDMVGALCPILINGYPLYTVMYHAPGGGYHMPDYLPANQLIDVDATGTGCVMIQRRVFETMLKNGMTWFDYELANLGREVHSSEDYSFCRKARSLGFRVYVHSGYICGHFKEVDLRLFVIRMNEAKRKAEEEIFKFSQGAGSGINLFPELETGFFKKSFAL